MACESHTIRQLEVGSFQEWLLDWVRDKVSEISLDLPVIGFITEGWLLGHSTQVQGRKKKEEGWRQFWP